MTRVGAGPTALPVSHAEHCMGTVFSFRVAAPGVDAASLRAVLDWLHAMDAMFSTYRADSEISRINAGTLTLTDASPEVHDVLAACAYFRTDTDGYFDCRPDGWTLDPSGYVKGWAVQHAADMLTAAGSLNHCVNGGGDVTCVGQPSPERGWIIGITDPLERGRLLTAVTGGGPLAVATSGLAERGAHILDPHTGAAVTHVASATVVAADLITADVYATAVAAMAPTAAARWLEARPTVRALLVERSGRRRSFGNWRARP
ncbi:FAD:protein FMN transferase [uncultured Jatrophihabitans sp.]|uniref:FAD:protein FMN transferase n=1 Tax=uncultured Jatrophihabitans sp. TaxID=1610747 RepID=UPI0035CBF207